MPLDPKALEVLQDGLKEGDIKFRFEGRFKGEAVRWVEIVGKRQENGLWSCKLLLGDGRELEKTFTEAEAEEEFTQALFGLHDWLSQEPRS